MADISSRIVIGFEIADRTKEAFEKLPTADLKGDHFRSELKKTFDYLRDYQGLSCLKPNLKFQKMAVHSDDIASMIKEICADRNILNRTRMIISEEELTFENVGSNQKGLFLISGNRVPSFESDPNDGTKFKVRMRSGWMSRFVFDYFAEIYVANSIPAITRYLQKNGNSLASLYESKDKFMKSDPACLDLPDHMSSGASPMSYASFFNAARETNEYQSRNVADKACLLWDKFISTNLFDFVSDKESVTNDVKRWKKISGMLPSVKLVERLKEKGPGAYLLVKQKRSAQIRAQEKSALRMHTLIGEGLPIGGNLSKGLAIFKPNERHSLLDWAIDSNYAQVFRIWIT